jgi:two-component system sensor histidine kinase UhpB
MILLILILSSNNQIFVAILISLSLLGIIYVSYVYIIIPLNQKLTKEKENLELNNARLMALFAKLNPEPLLRFNIDGTVILANNAANKLFDSLEIKKTKILSIFPSLKELDLKELIEKQKTLTFSLVRNKKYYEVIIMGVSDKQFGQIYCKDFTQRKIIEDELMLSQKKLRELSYKTQKLQEEEKQKIARELHDSIGQTLTSIRLNLEILKEGLSGDEDKLSKIKDIYVLIENATTEIREISHKLKPRVLDDFGLIPSLRALCNDISKSSGIKGVFESFKLNGRLNPELETGLYRIAQEALNNIVKYSFAKEFSMQLVKHPDFLRLMIEDDGVGFDLEKTRFDPAKKDCMGLINMSERTLSLKGKFNIDSKIGGGTEIIVEIPLEE